MRPATARPERDLVGALHAHELGILYVGSAQECWCHRWWQLPGVRATEPDGCCQACSHRSPSACRNAHIAEGGLDPAEWIGWPVRGAKDDQRGCRASPEGPATALSFGRPFAPGGVPGVRPERGYGQVMGLRQVPGPRYAALAAGGRGLRGAEASGPARDAGRGGRGAGTSGMWSASGLDARRGRDGGLVMADSAGYQPLSVPGPDAGERVSSTGRSPWGAAIWPSP